MENSGHKKSPLRETASLTKRSNQEATNITKGIKNYV
jgi:hypothetical protein